MRQCGQGIYQHKRRIYHLKASLKLRVWVFLLHSLFSKKYSSGFTEWV